MGGLSAGTWLRYDGDLAAIDNPGLAGVLLVALLAHAVIALPLQLYRGRYSTGSVDDAIGVTVAVPPWA